MQETRIFDLLERFSTVFTNKNDVFGAKENGQWKTYSTSDYIQFANYFSFGLLEMGFKKNDKPPTPNCF